MQLVSDRTNLWMIHTTAEKTDELFKKYNLDKKTMNVPERAFNFTPELVEKEFGIKPENVNSLKGLMGDSSDNIKGVTGIGEVTAVKLIQIYGTVGKLYDAIRDLDAVGQKKIKEYWKNEYGIKRAPLSYLLKQSDTEIVGEKSAILSEKLATIKRDIDLGDLKLDDLRIQIDIGKAREEFNKLEMKSLRNLNLPKDMVIGGEGLEDEEWCTDGDTPFAESPFVQNDNISKSEDNSFETRADISKSEDNPFGDSMKPVSINEIFGSDDFKDGACESLVNPFLDEDSYDSVNISVKKDLDLNKEIETGRDKLDLSVTQKVKNGMDEHIYKKRLIPVVREIIDYDEAINVIGQSLKAKKIGFQILIEKNKELDDITAYGIGIAFENEVAAIKAKNFITSELLSEWAREILSNCGEIYVMDLKSILSFVNREQIFIENKENVFDMGIAGYLINPLESDYPYEKIAKQYMDIELPSKKELLEKQMMAEAIDTEEFTNLIGYNAYIAVESSDILNYQLRVTKQLDLFYHIEMPLIYHLHYMERAGIAIEREELRRISEKLEQSVEELERKIYSQTHCEFNINSPKQLGEVLFEKLKLPADKKNKSKSGYSTAADVLEKLKNDYPVVNDILEYRQVTKLKSTYADGLKNCISSKDNRIHGTFNQTITATGRISSTEPNLQNIPIRTEMGREIRKAFVPKEGYVFVDADYSQIELRVMAHMSKDINLINAYKTAKDIHMITASEVFHTKLDEVTQKQRRNAKAVNFGIIYGMSEFSLSEDLSISYKEAQEYMQKYFETYPSVKRFLDDAVAYAKKNGYVTTMFGRRRPVFEILSTKRVERERGERIAMNSPIQGTAADIMKIAMIKVGDRLKLEKLQSRIVLQVHDELLIETKKDEIEKVKAILNDEMKNAVSLSVPLEIEINVGNSWFETK